MAAAGAEQQFASILKVDIDIRKGDLSVVYAYDPVVVRNSTNTLEKLLGEEDKYKVVGFHLEYTGGHARHDQMVAIA
ncbi:hypothetical protein D1007_60903 [Hordeum vulgare]|nr:hypothetical protein D1007_60903 [Hordeum vulgare]